MKRFTIFVLFCLFIFQLDAQNKDKNSGFISPVKPPFSFSGGFGELRTNHFHTGLDFRTGGAIGKPVYAVKEGYISRISVSPIGYGNALYMNHPDGTTSLYGHLSRFNPRIEAVVRDEQYYKESFAVDLNLSKNQIKFEKGEIIAWSGNSGSSAGPHLHFELRETKSENAVNPLFYHLGITDNSAPKINSLFVYPISNVSQVDKGYSKKRFETVPISKGYQVKGNLPIEVFGQIGIGIQAEDFFNGAGMKCGIYSALLKIDGKQEFAFKLDKLDFDLIRYVNSHVDYEEKIRSNRWVHQLFKLPGNRLNIYETDANKGILNIDDSKTHDVEIIVSDAFNNSTSLKFKLVSKPYEQVRIKSSFAADFKYDSQNVFENDNMRINLPEGALYQDLKFKYTTKPKQAGLFSEIHQIHNEYTPLQKSFSLSINTEGLTDKLKEKALVVKIDDHTGQKSSIGGNFSNGWVFTQSRIFGNFAVTVDTIAPKVIPLSIKEKKTLTNANKIEFTISDNLSGIKSYRGEIDGKWALFEFDAKKNLLSYTFDKTKMEFGKSHQLVLVVEDAKENRTVYKAKFYK